jgi:phospholipid/cholesterol/gamma-HCH transport system ATP-binding protein
MNAVNPGPIIRVENVHLRFGRVEVLRGVSFDVKPRETLCILGGSGGGKSTLLKIMIGHLKPTSGRVIIDGDDIVPMREAELNVVRRKFGVMFQLGALLNSMTIADNVALPIEFHTKLDDEVIATMVKIKLNQVDLREAAQKHPSEISGGMQKRAAIARALARDPKLLFYDEPSAGLDPISTTRIDLLINELKSVMGITNVVVTHVMESVRRIADHVVMLDRGRLVLDGSLADLMASHEPLIKAFVSGDLEAVEAGTERHDAFFRDLLM